jgi:hypothetical protein
MKHDKLLATFTNITMQCIEGTRNIPPTYISLMTAFFKDALDSCAISKLTCVISAFSKLLPSRVASKKLAPNKLAFLKFAFLTTDC